MSAAVSEKVMSLVLDVIPGGISGSNGGSIFGLLRPSMDEWIKKI